MSAELSPGERLWFEHEGLDLDDPRITPVRRQHGAAEVIDFDIAGADGDVRIRFDETCNGGGMPWVVTAGPEVLVGVRYEAVAAAVQAALDGQPTPAAGPA
jgi:hypothetical protein